MLEGGASVRRRGRGHCWRKTGQPQEISLLSAGEGQRGFFTVALVAELDKNGMAEAILLRSGAEFGVECAPGITEEQPRVGLMVQLSP